MEDGLKSALEVENKLGRCYNNPGKNWQGSQSARRMAVSI